MTENELAPSLLRADWPSVIESRLASAGIEDHQYVEVVIKLFESVQRGARSVGVAGSQGSGKSTLARVLQTLSEPLLGMRSVVLSLDDFYLTRSDRWLLASVHPLLKTRGVPGTHEVDGLLAALSALLEGAVAEIPLFDKGEDDRKSPGRLVGPCDFVIVEGWCLGAEPEAQGRLIKAINPLEATEDRDGIWRQYVNAALAGDAYRRLTELDFLLYLKPGSFDHVLGWREAQEQRFNHGQLQMNRAELERFIAHYERLTRWMMVDVPHRAQLTVTLDRNHCIERVDEKPRERASNVSRESQ
jgi:D-glycerate 3-kinase